MVLLSLFLGKDLNMTINEIFYVPDRKRSNGEKINWKN